MIEYFSEQLEQVAPLTAEDINTINTRRREFEAPDCEYKVGDILLYGLVIRDDPNHPKLDTSSMQLDDDTPHKIMEVMVFVVRDGTIQVPDIYEYQRMSNKFPVFKHKDEENGVV